MGTHVIVGCSPLLYTYNEQFPERWWRVRLNLLVCTFSLPVRVSLMTATESVPEFTMRRVRWYVSRIVAQFSGGLVSCSSSIACACWSVEVDSKYCIYSNVVVAYTFVGEHSQRIARGWQNPQWFFWVFFQVVLALCLSSSKANVLRCDSLI